jgi:hypothetical protein
MTVDVLYEGLPLLRGATLRDEASGLFLEWDAPMPVGTRLTLRGPAGDKSARVQRVTEGAGGGVLLKLLEAGTPREVQHDDKAERSEAPETDENGSPRSGDGKGGSRRDRRAKNRKTDQPH